jgi:DNA-binding transcriptional MerR regulator
MPRRFLTVSELVDRCSPPNKEYRTIWLRRARDWSNIGFLPTARGQHEGSGRHRLYSSDAVFLAAVLFRMADLGVPVGYLERIARLIRTPRQTEGEQEFKRFWQEAKALTNPKDAHLAIAPERGGVRTYYRHSFGPIELLDDEAWAVINLTRTFRGLKAQED